MMAMPARTTSSPRLRHEPVVVVLALPGLAWVVETEPRALRNNESAVKVTQTAGIRSAGKLCLTGASDRPGAWQRRSATSDLPRARHGAAPGKVHVARSLDCGYPLGPGRAVCLLLRKAVNDAPPAGIAPRAAIAHSIQPAGGGATQGAVTVVSVAQRRVDRRPVRRMAPSACSSAIGCRRRGSSATQ
jgi:hypothetical protein